MRYATIQLDTGTERFHPAERALHDEPTVTRESIHHIKLLNDGTIVILYHLRGDLDRAEAVLNACPTVLRCDIAGQGEGLGWNHSMAVDPAKSLLELLHESEVVVDTPLRYTSEGAVRVIRSVVTVYRLFATRFGENRQ